MTPSLAERLKALEDRLRDWIGTAHETDRLLLQDLDAIRAELIAIAETLRREKFAPGTPMWIRGFVCEAADRLAEPSDG